MSSNSNSIAFLPVNNNQKNSFNFKELSKLLNEMVSDASKSILEMKDDISEEKVQTAILKSIEAVYNKEQEVKKKKAKREKQALTSYIIYCNKFRPSVKESNPDMDPKDITRTLAEMWNKLTEEQKKPYVDESKRQAEIIKSEIENNKSSTEESDEEKKTKSSSSTKKEKKEKTSSESNKGEKDGKKTKTSSSSNKEEKTDKKTVKKNEVKAPVIQMDDEEPILDTKPTTKKSKK
jgi:hypothetical protein